MSLHRNSKQNRRYSEIGFESPSLPQVSVRDNKQQLDKVLKKKQPKSNSIENLFKKKFIQVFGTTKKSNLIQLKIFFFLNSILKKKKKKRNGFLSVREFVSVVLRGSRRIDGRRRPVYVSGRLLRHGHEQLSKLLRQRARGRIERGHGHSSRSPATLCGFQHQFQPSARPAHVAHVERRRRRSRLQHGTDSASHPSAAHAATATTATTAATTAIAATAATAATAAAAAAAAAIATTVNAADETGCAEDQCG